MYNIYIIAYNRIRAGSKYLAFVVTITNQYYADSRITFGELLRN